jgi:hypothetical protein
MPSSGISHCVALVRTDASVKHSSSIIRVTRIGELVKLSVTSNRRMHVVFLRSVRRLLLTINVFPSSSILVTLIIEVLCSSETSVHKEPHCVISQKKGIPHSHRRENLKSYVLLRSSHNLNFNSRNSDFDVYFHRPAFSAT